MKKAQFVGKCDGAYELERDDAPHAEPLRGGCQGGDIFFDGNVGGLDMPDVEEGFADDLAETFDEVELLGCDDL